MIWYALGEDNRDGMNCFDLQELHPIVFSQGNVPTVVTDTFRVQTRTTLCMEFKPKADKYLVRSVPINNMQ